MIYRLYRHLIIADPIVRISPYELHISDPDFFQSIYTREGYWNKYDWAVGAFGAPLSTICTIDHDTHRHRRAALNPFFSKANVARRQEILWRLAEKLSSRVDEFAGSQTRQICLGAAISAFTRDVTAEYVIGKEFANLDDRSFDAESVTAFRSSGYLWRRTKHIRWYSKLLKSIPKWLIKQNPNDKDQSFFSFLTVSSHPVCTRL
jgi:cytochrome P450